MNPYDLLVYLVLGALLGVVGQGIRIIVGIKKLLDGADSANKKLSELLDGKRMALSVGIALVVGVIAGALGVLDIDVIGKPISKESLATLISIGYAGTDFIEGFMRRT